MTSEPRFAVGDEVGSTDGRRWSVVEAYRAGGYSWTYTLSSKDGGESENFDEEDLDVHRASLEGDDGK